MNAPFLSIVLVLQLNSDTYSLTVFVTIIQYTYIIFVWNQGHHGEVETAWHSALPAMV